MNEFYKQIFEELVRAYYEGGFADKVSYIIKESSLEKDQICKIVSILCGVEIKSTENFIEELSAAIGDYRKHNKVVVKAALCSKECIQVGEKTICQNACPFEAILINEQTKCIEIDENVCTHCGACIGVCDSFVEYVEFMPVLNLIKNNQVVFAAVAPSIMGQFGENITLGQLRAALKLIGFRDMLEIAFFADMLTLMEAVTFNHFVHEKSDFMLSSCCCPIWVGMTKKHYKDIAKYVSPSVSPMIAAGRVIKALNKEAKVVFIGPCTAKKAEAKQSDIADAIDYVLEYKELQAIFSALGIRVEEMHEEITEDYASYGGRLYARVGGVSTAIGETVARMFPDKFKLFSAVQASGTAECKELLEQLLAGKLNATFIEGMGCKGGCVGGPKVLIPVEEGRTRANIFAARSSIQIPLDSFELKRFMQKLHFDSFEDFKDHHKTAIFERTF